MFKALSAFLVVLVIFSVPTSQAVEGYHKVSLIKLIAVPDEFVDKKVRVKGYFKWGMFAALYVNHLSADVGDWTSAIEVVDQTEEGNLTLSCDKMYVVLRGRFVRHEEHYEITDVVDVFDAKSLEPCWEKE